jgi:hypothetical protein
MPTDEEAQYSAIDTAQNRALKRQEEHARLRRARPLNKR